MPSDRRNLSTIRSVQNGNSNYKITKSQKSPNYPRQNAEASFANRFYWNNLSLDNLIKSLAICITFGPSKTVRPRSVELTSWKSISEGQEEIIKNQSERVRFQQQACWTPLLESRNLRITLRRAEISSFGETLVVHRFVRFVISHGNCGWALGERSGGHAVRATMASNLMICKICPVEFTL